MHRARGPSRRLPLIGRKLAELKRGTFASPEYLARFGTPHVPEDLFDGHQMVGLLSSDTPSVAPFAFVVAGKARELTLPTVVTVTGPETNVASACAGLGLIQVPRYRVASELASGALVEVLTDFPPSPLPVRPLFARVSFRPACACSSIGSLSDTGSAS